MNPNQIKLKDLEFQVLAELASTLKRLGEGYYEVREEQFTDGLGDDRSMLNITPNKKLIDAINAWTKEMSAQFDWDEYYNPGPGGDY